jgi:hypothetical protein
MSKKRLRLLVGTVSGHFTCNNHLFNIGLSTSRICNRCETDAETMYHLVCLCPTLAKRRFRILGDYVPCNQETKIGVPKVFRRIPKNSSTNICGVLRNSDSYPPNTLAIRVSLISRKFNR